MHVRCFYAATFDAFVSSVNTDGKSLMGMRHVFDIAVRRDIAYRSLLSFKRHASGVGFADVVSKPRNEKPTNAVHFGDAIKRPRRCSQPIVAIDKEHPRVPVSKSIEEIVVRQILTLLPNRVVDLSVLAIPAW